MRRALVVVGFTVSVAGCEACDDGESFTPPAPEPTRVTFEPACGSPGDTITVFTPRKPLDESYRGLGSYDCVPTAEWRVHFAPTATAVPTHEADEGVNGVRSLCRLDVIVPQEAVTGPLATYSLGTDKGTNTDYFRWTSATDFVVPCPPSVPTPEDSGPKDSGTPDADDPDGGAPSLLHGVVDLLISHTPNATPQAVVTGEFFPPTITQTPGSVVDRLFDVGDPKDIAARGLAWRNIGQCDTYQRPFPTSATNEGVGPIDVKAGATTRGSLMQYPNGSYLGNFVANANESLDVSFAGTMGFAAANVPSILVTHANVTVTQPDLTTGSPITITGGTFTVDYAAPPNIDRLYLHFAANGGGLPGWRCRLDPGATSFSTSTTGIPQSGTVYLMAVTEKTASVNGRVYLFTSKAKRSDVSYTKN